LTSLDFRSATFSECVATMHYSGYRLMWVVVMFDLPVDNKPARKAYCRFRTGLIRQGFVKLQFSVYARHCSSRENAHAHAERIRKHLPPDGEVRMIQITDKQFERMSVFFGNRRSSAEKGPRQLEFF
jgi:CRISPR-associated protein Cas2